MPLNYSIPFATAYSKVGLKKGCHLLPTSPCATLVLALNGHGWGWSLARALFRSRACDFDPVQPNPEMVVPAGEWESRLIPPACPQVLKWVEEAIQASKVHLLSTDHEDGGQHTWPVPFDPSLKEVTISLSGPAPGIEVRDPAGRSPGEGNGQGVMLCLLESLLCQRGGWVMGSALQ